MKSKSMKLDYKKTFILGLGFFSASIIWPIYNNYVPIMLESYIKSGTFIGAIMTIDNIFAVVKACGRYLELSKKL